jgi:acrylyl-CoA reductase (NADPH)
VAVSGKPDAQPWLSALGTAEVITREAATETTRPMLKERWAGVVDTVGGEILATAIKSTRRDGCVTACGLVQSATFTSSVFPFILRGVTLAGVDSVEVSLAKRDVLWDKMTNDWQPSETALAAIGREVTLDALDPEIDAILRGAIRGRVVVRHV